MDERCQSCPYICKRLYATDVPARYVVSKFSSEQVLTLIESTLRSYAGWHFFQVQDAERSCGNQLAVLLEAQYMPTDHYFEETFLTFIAQAQSSEGKSTLVWFRYGIPEACCDQPHVVSEFNELMGEIIEPLIRKRLDGKW